MAPAGLHYLLLLIWCGLGICGLRGQVDSTEQRVEKKLSFKDPEDGAIDLSQFLLEAHGVLPVLIPLRNLPWVTEEAQPCYISTTARRPIKPTYLPM